MIDPSFPIAILGSLATICGIECFGKIGAGEYSTPDSNTGEGDDEDAVDDIDGNPSKIQGSASVWGSPQSMDTKRPEPQVESTNVVSSESDYHYQWCACIGNCVENKLRAIGIVISD